MMELREEESSYHAAYDVCGMISTLLLLLCCGDDVYVD